MTKFIEKSYIVASIMKFNREYYHICYVTERQLNVLCWYIQRKIKELNIDATIIDYINNFYFDDLGYKVLLNEDYINDFEKVLKNYKKNLPDNIYSLIWEEDSIYSIMTEKHTKESKKNIKTLNKKEVFK